MPPPPFRRDRAVPARPADPLDFDWAVVPAILGEVSAGDPAAWAGLAAITAPTLLIGGGPARPRRVLTGNLAAFHPLWAMESGPAG